MYRIFKDLFSQIDTKVERSSDAAVHLSLFPSAPESLPVFMALFRGAAGDAARLGTGRGETNTGGEASPYWIPISVFVAFSFSVPYRSSWQRKRNLHEQSGSAVFRQILVVCCPAQQ